MGCTSGDRKPERDITQGEARAERAHYGSPRPLPEQPHLIPNPRRGHSNSGPGLRPGGSLPVLQPSMARQSPAHHRLSPAAARGGGGSGSPGVAASRPVLSAAPRTPRPIRSICRRALSPFPRRGPGAPSRFLKSDLPSPALRRPPQRTASMDAPSPQPLLTVAILQVRSPPRP